MNKSNLTNWLSALCAGLLIVVLVLQSKQKGELESLRQGHESFVAATDQRQREALDAVSNLTDNVTTLRTNLESRLTQGGQQAKEQLESVASATEQRQRESRDAIANLASQVTDLRTNLESRLSQSEQQAKERIEAFASATEQRQRESRDALSKLSGQVTAMGTILESRLAQGEQQSKEKFGHAMNAIQQQTAVLHRALGKVIPVELPESLTKKLAALEGSITDEKSWPKDGAGVDKMVSELRDLTRQIPPWAEEDLLPRLNAVRWGASALTLVRKDQPVASDALGDFLDDVDTAIEAKPDGASALVLKRLIELQSTLKEKFDMARRNTAIADAERFITDGATHAEFSDVLELLSEWAGVPEFKERVQKLQRELRARVLADDTSRFITSVEATLQRARKEPNRTIRQISLSGLLGSVLSQRQTLLENQDAAKSLSDSLSEQAMRIEHAIEEDGKAQAAEQDKKLREYQRWALSQIRECNRAVSGHEIAIKGTFRNSPDYRAIMNDMIQFLVPISVPHLDPAVSRLYNEAFEKGWKLLDGKDEKYLQTRVAEQEAVVSKRKP